MFQESSVHIYTYHNIINPAVGDMSGNHSLQNLSCTRLPEVASYQQQVTNNGALGKDNTGTCI